MLNLYLEDITAVKNVDTASARTASHGLHFQFKCMERKSKKKSVHKSHESVEPVPCLGDRIILKVPRSVN